MHPLFRQLILIVSIVFFVSPVRAEFIHPGLLHSEADIQYMRDRVDFNDPYWQDFRFRADEVADYFAQDHILRAALPHPNIYCYRNTKSAESLAEPSAVSCKEITEFGKYAYTASLYWRLTGSTRHLDAAITIIRFWANNFLSINPADSLSLATNKVGWAIPQFLNALELLRGTYPKADEAQLVEDFTDRLGNALTRGENYRTYFEKNTGNNLFLTNLNNHTNANTEALMALAIYKDDQSLFERAIALVKHELRMYIHLEGDSVTRDNTVYTSPINLSSEIQGWGDDERLRQQWHYPRDWRGIGGNALVSGMQMETCRDMNHTDMGFRTLMYSTHMAYMQGYDLFRQEQDRITAFLELHNRWMFEGTWDDVCIDTVTRGTRVPTCNWYREDTPIEEQPTAPCKVHFRKYGNKVRTLENGKNTVRLIDRLDAWHLAYSHISRRLGIEIPYTGHLLKTFESSFDKFQRPSNQHINLTKWEGIGYASGLFDRGYHKQHCHIKDGATYGFKNKNSRKYIHRTRNGNLVQYGWKSKGHNKNYRAKLIRRQGNDEFYTFEHISSQTLLGINYSGNHPNYATSTDLRPTKNRQFKLETHPDGSCKLIVSNLPNDDLRKCLAIENDSTDHFSKLVRTHCTVSSGWHLEEIHD